MCVVLCFCSFCSAGTIQLVVLHPAAFTQHQPVSISPCVTAGTVYSARVSLAKQLFAETGAR